MCTWIILKYEEGICSNCPLGKFSHEVNAAECNPCQVDRAICYGKTYLSILPGFWRPYNKYYRFD